MAKKKELKKASLSKGFQKIPLIDIQLCSWNYKKFNDPELQNKLVANIKKNGLIENLITYENDKGEVILANGNHRYLALQTLKYDEADCYHLGKLTDAQAKRIAVETNETKFATDKEKLAELVNSISAEFLDFSETNPFDEKEMNVFADMLKDSDLVDDEKLTEKPKKSKTSISGGGETYTTVKLELTPALADRFSNALAKFTFMEGNEKPLDIIVQLVEKYSVDEILEITGNQIKKLKGTIKRK